MENVEHQVSFKRRGLCVLIVATVVAFLLLGRTSARADVSTGGGGAVGEQVRGVAPAGPVPSVSLPNGGGGPFTASAASVNVSNVLKTGAMTATTKGATSSGNQGYSQSSVKVSGATIAGVISFDVLTAACRSDASGSRGAVSAVDLKVLGVRIASSASVSINLPAGKVLINEQVKSNSNGSTSITVNALHVTLLDKSILKQDIIVGQARCQARGSDVNAPPTTTPPPTTAPPNRDLCVGGCSIFSPSSVPGTPNANDDVAYDLELGVRFRADVAGQVTGVRFYKGDANIGTHTGSLWDNAGNLLATGTYANETPSGWQQLNFDTPVAVAANTTYVASYHLSSTHYAFDGNYFSFAGVDAPPLHALADGIDGYDGSFKYAPGGTGAFPNEGFGGANYWVDVVFTPAP